MCRVRFVAAASPIVLLAPIAALHQQAVPDLGDAVARVGGYVETYLSVARTVVAREQVTLQPLDRDGRAEGRERRLLYETQVEWDPGSGGGVPTASVRRTLLSVDGREVLPGIDAGCLLPSSPEPLAFLLPDKRGEFAFTAIAAAQVDRQPALVLQYEPLRPGTPSLRWLGDCGSIELPGLTRGRLTLHRDSFAVLKLDTELVSPIRIPLTQAQRRRGWGDSLLVERTDVSIAFEPVRFRNPDETLYLATRVRRVTVVRTPETSRLEVTQRLSDYRRFLTGARIRTPQ